VSKNITRFDTRFGFLSCNFIYDGTGLFHADPHRGNLLREKSGNLAFIDFGMMADVTEEERYGLVGLAIGLQNKDLPLITENLLNVRSFLLLPTHCAYICIFFSDLTL